MATSKALKSLILFAALGSFAFAGTPAPPPTTSPSPATIINLATRLQVGIDDKALITGFIVQGTGPGCSRLLLHDQAHPIHIHDVEWQILDVDGIAPAPGDDGMKDTFLVPAGGTVRVIGTFTDNLGLYVSHCHILEHEEHAMMINFEVQQ
jgi:hypothetical protein